MPIALTSAPVRFDSSAEQELRLAANVAQYDTLELLLNVYEGSSVSVAIWTGMQTDSETGWVNVGSFEDSGANQSWSLTISNHLRFVRWKATADAEATFMITGVATRRT